MREPIWDGQPLLQEELDVVNPMTWCAENGYVRHKDYGTDIPKPLRGDDRQTPWVDYKLAAGEK